MITWSTCRRWKCARRRVVQSEAVQVLSHRYQLIEYYVVQDYLNHVIRIRAREPRQFPGPAQKSWRRPAELVRFLFLLRRRW